MLTLRMKVQVRSQNMEDWLNGIISTNTLRIRISNAGICPVHFIPYENGECIECARTDAIVADECREAEAMNRAQRSYEENV